MEYLKKYEEWLNSNEIDTETKCNILENIYRSIPPGELFYYKVYREYLVNSNLEENQMVLYGFSDVIVNDILARLYEPICLTKEFITRYEWDLFKTLYLPGYWDPDQKKIVASEKDGENVEVFPGELERRLKSLFYGDSTTRVECAKYIIRLKQKFTAIQRPRDKALSTIYDYVIGLDLFEILKEKKLENIKTHTPEVYIDDFEIYMHQFKSNEEKENSEKIDKITIYLNRIIVLVICLVIGITLSNFLVDYKTLFQIINIGLLIITSTQLFNALSIKLSKGKSEREYLKELNNNPEIIARFEELKYVLGINNKYDRVYTKEGAEYITWLANGYFHVFLNLIYFNVVYMVVKMSDVTYYKKEKNECIIKLKNRTLTFKPEAEQVFKKILPNKDYNWLKGFPKK